MTGYHAERYSEGCRECARRLIAPTNSNEQVGGAWFRYPAQLVFLGAFLAGGYEMANGNETFRVENDGGTYWIFTADDLQHLKQDLFDTYVNRAGLIGEGSDVWKGVDNIVLNPTKLYNTIVGLCTKSMTAAVDLFTAEEKKRLQALIASNANATSGTFNGQVYTFTTAEKSARDAYYQMLDGLKTFAANTLTGDTDSVKTKINDLSVELKNYLNAAFVGDSSVKSEITVKKQDLLDSLDTLASSVTEKLDGLTSNSAQTSLIKLIDSTSTSIKNAINAIDVSGNVSSKEAAIRALISGIDVSEAVENTEVRLQNDVLAIKNKVNEAINEMHNAIIDQNWTDTIVQKFSLAFELWLNTSYTQWCNQIVSGLTNTAQQAAQGLLDVQNAESTLSGYISEFSRTLQQANDIADVYSDLRGILNAFYAHVQENADLTDTLNTQTAELTNLNRELSKNLSDIQSVISQGNKLSDVKDVTVGMAAIVSALAAVKSNKLTQAALEKSAQERLY